MTEPATEPLRIERHDRTAVVVLDRPAERNALNAALRGALPTAMADLAADDAVDVIVLTGADPAFCAGLDLAELGRGDHRITGGAPDSAGAVPRGPWAPTGKPVIGAVNGAAVTGGFELALNCDFLIASERAAFADTHARVGVMPGWGLTVLLPEAIGIRRAREMSLTGNFMGAEEALRFGLVNHVVAHDDLLSFTLSIAADIAGNDGPGVRQMLATYAETAGTTVAAGWGIEARRGRAWAGDGVDPDLIESRRAAIIDRGRAQID